MQQWFLHAQSWYSNPIHVFQTVTTHTQHTIIKTLLQLVPSLHMILIVTIQNDKNYQSIQSYQHIIMIQHSNPYNIIWRTTHAGETTQISIIILILDDKILSEREWPIHHHLQPTKVDLLPSPLYITYSYLHTWTRVAESTLQGTNVQQLSKWQHDFGLRDVRWFLK